MDSQPPIALITGLIFVFAIIGTGAWLTVKGRYHIFFFSLCILFAFNALMMLATIGTAIRSAAAGQVQAYEGSDAIAYEAPSAFEWHVFFQCCAMSFFVLVILLSLINLFIRKNKLAVKVLSGIMLLICTLLVIGVYLVLDFISDLGKIGG